MVTQAELEAAIYTKLDDVSVLFVSDVSGGCGQAYDIVLVSDQFEGMPTLRRHRLVNDRLKEEIAAMHAFSQKTYTNKQFEGLKANYANQTPSAPRAAAPTAELAAFIPELWLTPDPSHAQTVPSTQMSIDDARTSIEGSAGISRLHYKRITSVEFWLGLRKSLEEQFLNADTMDLDSPGAASPHARCRTVGEAEVERLFEDFFLSQKHNLSANDVARIRDATGMLGMAGA
ncbi:hypothetical protein MVES1_003596 [Malassezia vespertilionis]|uniref:Bola-like protein n=1 Tax=Malassezia vespertilionis TaxID=2020962 RepID=A0A2N1J8N9_9BASI|nr:uncharacterized protein MVES1_003596 [Malassezia vespertilionis]PKI82906.1 hypothetical protein MVES_003167 [Malassezia vespertilionis]WFD08224.1 hypothetical protein MVES1_003596 [Malassezia vespertilionis]